LSFFASSRFFLFNFVCLFGVVHSQFKVELEEQLKLQKTEVIPFMQRHLTESQAKVEGLEKALKAAQIENENLHCTILAEKKLRIEASEALVDEMEQKRDLEKVLSDTHDKHAGELKKEKTLRLATENGIGLLQTPTTTTSMTSTDLSISLLSSPCRSLTPVDCQQGILKVVFDSIVCVYAVCYFSVVKIIKGRVNRGSFLSFQLSTISSS